MSDQWETQKYLLLITVGMAFLIATAVFGAGIGAVLWQQAQITKELRAEFAYAQDMAEIRHRESFSRER